MGLAIHAGGSWGLRMGFLAGGLGFDLGGSPARTDMEKVRSRTRARMSIEVVGLEGDLALFHGRGEGAEIRRE